ncbi:hypothetical protein M885DRAFT_251706 [Pelagophyceae sp. CCMP2097]|nr:hypothetical protein M885DRAFT_251706 [Pelagophyceae sp. CCMP2097]
MKPPSQRGLTRKFVEKCLPVVAVGCGLRLPYSPCRLRATSQVRRVRGDRPLCVQREAGGGDSRREGVRERDCCPPRKGGPRSGRAYTEVNAAWKRARRRATAAPARGVRPAAAARAVRRPAGPRGPAAESAAAPPAPSPPSRDDARLKQMQGRLVDRHPAKNPRKQYR